MKNNLHPEIVKFLCKSEKIFEALLPSNIGTMTVYYSGVDGWFNIPPLKNIIAFGYPNGSIRYRLNNINYNESDMLKIIKLSSFV